MPQAKPKGVKSNNQRQVPRWYRVTFKDGETYTVSIQWLQQLPEGKGTWQASTDPASALRRHVDPRKGIPWRGNANKLGITKLDTFIVFTSALTGAQVFLNVHPVALAKGTEA